MPVNWILKKQTEIEWGKFEVEVENQHDYPAFIFCLDSMPGTLLV